MRKLIFDRSLWAFVLAYGAAIGMLVVTGRPLEDVIGAGVVLGLILPLIAWLACLGMPAPTRPMPWKSGEGRLMVALLVWIVVFLAFKGPLLAALTPVGADARLADTLNTLAKIVAFVAIPGAVIGWRGWGWGQSGQPTAPIVRRLVAFMIVAAAAVAVQYLMGSQFHRLLDGDYRSRHLAVGAAFCFVWMCIEAGLVEEFFFRWYLQSRLAAWTGSQFSAVLLGALVFGLAHAPGMLLRGAGVVEGLGESPPLAATVAYAIAVQGVAGLVFGVLWARTRSFIFLVALHGLFDALSNTASFMDTWRL